MAFYQVCPHCGSNLDPSEICDCTVEAKKTEEFFSQRTKTSPKTGQLSFMMDRKDFGYEAKSVI